MRNVYYVFFFIITADEGINYDNCYKILMKTKELASQIFK